MKQGRLRSPFFVDSAAGFVMIELLGLLSLGIAWLVPNHYPPWSSFYNDSAAALGLLLMTSSVWRELGRVRAPAAAWFVVCVAAVPWLQWSLGWVTFAGDALVSALYLLGLAMAIAVGNAWAGGSQRDAAARLSWTILLAAFVSSILALVQGLQVGSFGIWVMDAIPGMRPYANLGQPNNLATLIGLGVIGLLLLREQDCIGKVAAALLLASLIAAASLTQSRTALLFGPIILLVVIWAKRRRIPLRTGLPVFGVAIVAHWALVLSWPVLQTQLGLAASESVAGRGIGSRRMAVWQILLDALSDSPWHGYGWLQTGAAQLAAADRHLPVGEMWLQGHNLFIDLLVWCGYPLGLALCGFLVYWYVSRLLRVSSLQGVAGVLSVSVLAVHAMLELPHHYAYFLIPIGLWVGQVEHQHVGGARGPLAAQWVWGPAIAGVLLFAAVWRNYPAVEEDFRLVRFENFKIGSVRAEQPAPDAPYLSGLTAFLSFARTTPVPGMTAAQLSEMEKVVQRYPYAGSMSRYARALALNGRTDEAQRIFSEIRHIHGEILYRDVKRELRERIEQGEAGLQVLENRLAD